MHSRTKVFIREFEFSTGKVEFKESLSLKEELGRSISGFANTCDGIILIGVSDKGKINGVEIGKKTIEDLANYIKQNTENQIYPDIL